MKAALIALALLATPANAFTLDMSADTIAAGQSVTLSFTIMEDSAVAASWLPNADASFTWHTFGTYDIEAGDGQIVFGAIALGGGSIGIVQQTQSATFTYANPGIFVPHLSGSMTGGFVDGALACFQCIFSGSLVADWPAITVTAVPEPATWGLMLFGFAFFAIKGIWPAWNRK